MFANSHVIGTQQKCLDYGSSSSSSSGSSSSSSHSSSSSTFTIDPKKQSTAIRASENPTSLNCTCKCHCRLENTGRDGWKGVLDVGDHAKIHHIEDAPACDLSEEMLPGGWESAGMVDVEGAG